MGEYTINWPQWSRFKAVQGEKIMRLTVTEARITARRYVLFTKYPRKPWGGVRLGDSIYGTVRRTANGFTGRIGSNLRYAASVESGAVAHIIRPRAGMLGNGEYFSGRYLHFFWYKRGRWVNTRMVRHPGQQGKHYLLRALVRVGRRRGFIVVPH